MQNLKRASVAFVTLGCAKNETDTRAMGDRLVVAGYELTDDLAKADAIVVNTCSFIQAATEESLDAIFSAADMPRVESGEVPLIVAGCMPARYADDLADELKEASALLPCADEENIVQVVSDCLKKARNANNKKAKAGLSAEVAADLEEFVVSESSNDYFAYVKISDGCDRRCSYCTIPDIRGAYKSTSYEDIERDVADQIMRSAKEIVLVAQDTGRWGSDLPEPRSLAWLLDALSDEFSDVRFRTLYIQPENITDELLNVLAQKDNVCNYLDIPLQHVSKRVLRAMNRSGSEEKFELLVSHAREKVPGIALRTTLIAGFPGETEDEFEQLVDFAASGLFDYIGVFAYSREDGTPAAELPDQIDEDEKQWRAQKLRDAADAACTAKLSERIGSVQRVLIEGREADGQLYGRSELQAPEVDGITFVGSGEPGDIVDVVIEDTLFFDMEGLTADVE